MARGVDGRDSEVSDFRLVLPPPPSTDLPPYGANTLAFRIVGAYLAVGMVYLMLTSGGAPFVQNPDPHWRKSMSESAGFLIVTATLIYLLARHGFGALLIARQDAAKAKIELIHRLAVVAEWKDDTIGGHNLRIARTSNVLAEKLGLSVHRQSLIYHGAVLHDIGKVGMPDYLLRKNGRFTSQERSLMERHVLLGASLLDGSDDELLRVARSIALTHHENWDGTGYPNGLVGEQIPIEGRIVAVCDVLDALLSRRPYKEAWEGEEAIRYIIDQRGQKFDPRVVDAMLDTLPHLVAARTEAGQPWITARNTIATPTASPARRFDADPRSKPRPNAQSSPRFGSPLRSAPIPDGTELPRSAWTDDAAP